MKADILALLSLFLCAVFSQLIFEDEDIDYDANDDKQLILLFEVSRHGARSPTGNKDTWFNITWEMGSGQLTYIGERQHYLQGRRIRKMYVDQAKFLPANFDPQTIYIRSTDYNRTIMSAISQMQGLYPLGSGKVFSKSEERQKALPPYPITATATEVINQNVVLPGKFSPFPVHVQLKQYEYMLRGYDSSICQIMGKFTKESIEEADKKTRKELQPLYDELYQKFQVPNASLTLQKAENYVDSYLMAKMDGKTFKNDLSPLAQNLTIEYFKYLYYDGMFGNKKSSQLTASTFMEYLNTTIKAKISAFNGDKNATDFHKNVKFIYFSAHDTTIAGFLSAIGQGPSQKTLPPLASMILIEVYKKGGQYYLNWRYNGEYLKVTSECNSQGDCPLNSTLDFFSNMVYENLEAECNTIDVADDKFPLYGIILLVISGLIIIALISGLCAWWAKARGNINDEDEMSKEYTANLKSGINKTIDTEV